MPTDTYTLPGPTYVVNATPIESRWYASADQKLPNRVIFVEDGNEVFQVAPGYLPRTSELVERVEQLVTWAHWPHLSKSKGPQDMEGGIVIGFPNTSYFDEGPRNVQQLTLDALKMVALDLDLNITYRIHNAPDFDPNGQIVSIDCGGPLVNVDLVFGEPTSYGTYLLELNVTSRRLYGVHFWDSEEHNTTPSKALTSGLVLRGSMIRIFGDPKIEEIYVIGKSQHDNGLDVQSYGLSDTNT